jgi:hypothetical protein
MDNSQFLAAVLDVIRLNYPSGSPDGLSAARIGLLVRHAFPKLEWISLGFPKLKDVLAELETQGLIRTGANRKGAFSVWLASEPQVPYAEPKPTIRGSHSPMLRREVWYAFISSSPPGRRFLERKSGSIRMAVANEPVEAGDWVEIQPIAQDTQRSWARDFLSSQNLPDEAEAEASISDAEWFRSLADFLTRKHPELLASWNRLRTQNTVSQVRQWCEEHSVPFELVTELPRWQQLNSRVGTIADANDLRRALLHAIQQMPTSELLELPIKAKHLVQALRPDLTTCVTRDGAGA